MADARALAFLDELERADSAAAATLAELDELAAEVDEIRIRAVELVASLVRPPVERTPLEVKRDEAARAEAVRAESVEVEKDSPAGDRAGQRGGAAPQHRTSLLARAVARDEETVRLLARAGRIAEDMRDRPRLAETADALSGGDLAAVASWAGASRAALFVARGSLAAERDAFLRQASELGTLVLGEPVFAASAAQIARRVRRSG